MLSRMPLTSHEEIGRIGRIRIGRGCYEDNREDPHEDVCNKSCVSCSWTLENDTDTRTNGQHYTAADRRPTNQVSAWQAGQGRRRTRPTCCGHRENVTRMLHVPVEFKPYCANAASPQRTKQMSDISADSAGPARLYAAERIQPDRLRHLANASEVPMK